MKDLKLNISKLPQNLQDLIGEFNVEHRLFYRGVMKELEKNSTCYLCKSISGCRYRCKYDFSHIYCSKVCRDIPGLIGGLSYCN